MHFKNLILFSLWWPRREHLAKTKFRQQKFLELPRAAESGGCMLQSKCQNKTQLEKIDK